VPCRPEHSARTGSTYTLRWLSACAILAAVGVGLGMLMWGPIVALLGVAFGSLAAWWLCVCTLPDQRSDRPGSRFSPAVVATSSLTGGGAVGLRAVFELSPAIGIVVLLAVVATCPALVNRLRTPALDRVESDVPPLAATQKAIWAASTAALASTSSVQDRLELIEARQHMLDALFDDRPR